VQVFVGKVEVAGTGIVLQAAWICQFGSGGGGQLAKDAENIKKKGYDKRGTKVGVFNNDGKSGTGALYGSTQDAGSM